jgi:hypothetical protein
LKVGIVIRRILLSRGWDQAGLIWPTLFIFWIGSAFALWLVENDVPGSSISTFPDAMTAAFLTAATLGFGKHWVPVTQDGQIISAVIVFFALGLWGFASSNLTRLWLNAKEDRAGGEIESIRGELQAIGAQLTYLCEALRARQSLDVPVQVTARTATDEPEYVHP